MNSFKWLRFFVVVITVYATQTGATVIGFSNCTSDGTISCAVTNTPPNPVVVDTNDGVLLVWDEVQNYTLLNDLAVDRVFDPGASFISGGPGNYFIAAGTVVSSHYVQWEPLGSEIATANATIDFDSQIFAFITSDQKLFDSDIVLGKPGVNYNNFTNRGIEPGDTTDFNGNSTDISWLAGSPGDWSRLITAYSPTVDVPEPASTMFLGLSVLGFSTWRKRSLKL
ncbi:hypothetical protein RJ45_13210 [Photobacterium gaetbulicola]|uniref:Ice-binding protein C-terminal domain-containing protein n=1 Tax=Photobacterium gaetbulicola TaxID=1295392 RepID=A0A0B9G400_9GAMM|nr:PEP-CTERM sorting domain-containing protein [Photobacterium gaetbulicola]KHT63344.1 hypothetical protein RJ45_13210 [Photobacterium gaetbulicola]